MTSSYPRRETTIDSAIGKARLCTELPSLRLPDHMKLPSLPSPLRPLEFAPGYTVTTHLVPAAYPRVSYQEPKQYATTSLDILNDAPPDSAPKEVRHNWSSETGKKLLKKREDLLHARVNHSPQDGSFNAEDTGPVLWNVVNRYARTKPSKDKRDFGITVVACHANGLHKEVRPIFSMFPLRCCFG